MSSLKLFRSAGLAMGRTCVRTPQGLQVRPYTHWKRTFPEDFELPMDTMPKDMSAVMKKKPQDLDFFENYWFWRVKSETNLLKTDKLAEKSYEQLAKDMGMPIVTAHTEHHIGLLELYEYLKSAPFVGPFGTIENPVVVPSVHNERFVACTGGTGDNEHVPLWFRCREGFLYRCGECDQIFMLVRTLTDFADESSKRGVPEDTEELDVFDKTLIEQNQRLYNNGEYVQWPVGDAVYQQVFLEGGWGNVVPHGSTEAAQTTPGEDHQR